MGKTAEVILHSMTLEDIETIYEIENQSFKTGWSLNYFKECVASQQHLKIVAEIDKKISAYAIIQTSKEKNFYLLKFVVAPEWRRHGLGKTFLETLLKLITKWGGAAVYLHVNTKNVAAIRLYESCGFKVFERIENFYREDKENAFTMERKI